MVLFALVLREAKLSLLATQIRGSIIPSALTMGKISWKGQSAISYFQGFGLICSPCSGVVGLQGEAKRREIFIPETQLLSL